MVLHDEANKDDKDKDVGHYVNNLIKIEHVHV